MNPEKEKIHSAFSSIEDVLDTLTEVGNGATDEALWEARGKLFEARDILLNYFAAQGIRIFSPLGGDTNG